MLEYFSNYDFIIWIDGSIQLLNNINPLINDFTAKNKDLYAFSHQHRQNVYQELDAVVRLKKDSGTNIEKLKKSRDLQLRYNSYCS